MDVIVSRSGGLAGLRLTWEVRVDEQPDADDWYVLIEEIPWSQPPPVRTNSHCLREHRGSVNATSADFDRPTATRSRAPNG